MKKQHETQEKQPHIPLKLSRVGVTNLRTITQINWKGVIYRFVPEIQLTIDLPETKKGVHMSRLVESTISEAIETESVDVHQSFEQLMQHILKRLAKKHPFTCGTVHFKTELVIPSQTPVSKKNTFETHDVEVEVRVEKHEWKKCLTVNVIGNTSCPHAMENTGGRPHIQRARARVSVSCDISKDIKLEDLITLAESSFSSPVYTLLKTEDENHVVNGMFENPLFVEDVCRKIIAKLKQDYSNIKAEVRVVSEESIHRHDVLAEAEI